MKVTQNRLPWEECGLGSTFRGDWKNADPAGSKLKRKNISGLNFNKRIILFCLKRETLWKVLSYINENLLNKNAKSKY